MILQLLINGLITGLIYSVVSLGFSLVYNTTRIFHIAFAALYMITPYLVITFCNMFHIPIIINVIIAILCTGLLGLCIDYFIYRPLNKRGSSQNVIMLSSIGVMIIIINVVALIYGNEPIVLTEEISKSYLFGAIVITETQLVQSVVSITLLLSFFIFLKFTKLGIQTRAYRDDAKLTSILRVNTTFLRGLFFVLSSIFAAIGSCLIAFDFGMNPYIGMPMLLNAVVALIIGGIGRFEAPIIGGLILGILQSSVVYLTSTKWQDAITFTVLILFLILRPSGIIGEKTRNV